MSHPLQPLAHAIRFLAVDAIVRAGEGHQGVPLGMAETATALYTRHLRHHPADPRWPDRDRVVLSNGHGSMLLYALLYLSGYERISQEQLEAFRELGAHTAGHPEIDHAAGIEVTTGLLGQGIANAVGMAVAEEHLRARFGPGLVDHFTWAFVGDGCLQEGIGQEAIALAGHLQLGKLVFLWDDNRITDDGPTELAISESVPERFRVAQWHVLEVDGHDIEAVSAAIAEAKRDPRPSLVACRTVIARGIERLQGQRGGHSAQLFEADAQQARERLGWRHPPFEVPPPVLQAWREAAARSRPAFEGWQQRLAALPAAERTEFERVMRGELPARWRDLLYDHKRRALAADASDAAAGGAQSGIFLSGEIHERLNDALPERIVLCPDLEAPTSHKRGVAAFTAAERVGRYLHCGVREHLMGAMANGLAAHGGVLPVAVTYLAFSDYMRAALRMAALMALPVKFVFSHDSIGIGKNGPTHQPVETLASLRAMPNMLVMRPADIVEASECWELALEHRSGPVSLVFARQALPRLRSSAARSSHADRAAAPAGPGCAPPDTGARAGQPAPPRGVLDVAADEENPCRRGAYVLAEAVSGARQVTLLATGSEVALALRARDELHMLGLPTAVVSMPCWELFERQDAGYRHQVLGPGTLRVGIEAAVRFGWERWLGEHGLFVGMAGFGASGPADELYRHFGITAEAVVAAVHRRLGAPAADAAREGTTTITAA
jgi:transketolase